MIALASVTTQDESIELPLEHMHRVFEIQSVIDRCVEIRNAKTEAEQTELKQYLPLLMLDEDLFAIDIDGSNHKSGNAMDIPFDEIAKKIPHLAWFISPSGKGMKLIIQISRKCAKDERKGIYIYLLEQIAETTGLVIDPDSRNDVAYCSDQPLHISDGIFDVPEVLEKQAIVQPAVRTKTKSGSMSKDLRRLKEILDLCEDKTSYKRWVAIVMSALMLCREDAIPLLKLKWDTRIPYESMLKCAGSYNSNILDKMWCDRIKQCGRKENDPYSRKAFAGATGSGKSAAAISNMKSAIVDREDVLKNYVICIVPSVVQGIDLAKKLKKVGITYEIIVGKQKYSESPPNIQKLLVTESSKKTNVKIIQLAALKGNSFFNYVYSDNRRLRHIYIDELTITDFIRPSIMTSSSVRGQLEISTDDTMIAKYKKEFSNEDLSFAKKLAENRDDSHFISSILFHDVDTTVLTTEDLTIECLERLDFKITTLKKKETDKFRDTCTLHMSISPEYVVEYVQNEEFKLLIDDHKFDNVFANKSEYATGNLITIKGQHIRGKNLTIIRNLPLDFVAMNKDLFTRCFKTSEIDPVALLYKDSLMQAVGRSIGFRGDTEAWVMLHSKVWSMLSGYDFIYKIQDWKVEVSDGFKNKIAEKRNSRKETAKVNNDRTSVFWAKDKEAKIKNKLAVTDDQSCIITKENLRRIFGTGYTLTDVAAVFNKKIHGRPRHIKGVKQVL